MRRIDPDQSLVMKISHFRSKLAAGAVAFVSTFQCIPATAVDVPLPETELPALRDLVGSALSRSPRAIARELEFMHAEHETLVSSSPLLPRVDGSYDYQIRQEELPGLAEQQTVQRTFYNLSISQPLWHWGSLRATSRVGRLGRDVAEQNLNATRRELALEVRDAYLALIVQKLAVRNARFNEKVFKDSLAIQETRFKTNEITQGFLEDFRLRANEVSLATEMAASNLEFAVRAFRHLTGVDGFSESDIPEAIPAPAVDARPEVPDGSTGYLKSEALLTKELEIQQGKLNYKINRNTLWPKLNAMAGVYQDDNLYSANRDQRLNNTAAYVGIHVQWSIFDGFASKGRRLQSRARIRQLEETRSDLLEALKDSADRQAAAVGFTWQTHRIAAVRHQYAVGGLAYEKDNLTRGLSSEEQIANAQAALNHAELVANDALAKFYSAAARYASSMRADPLIDGTNEN